MYTNYSGAGSRRARPLLGMLFACLLLPFTASAAIYMQFEGIEGDVNRAGYEGWIELINAGYAFERAISTTLSGAGGRETSRPNLSEVKVLKGIDIATARLMEAALVGRPALVRIHFVVDGETPFTYFALELRDTLIAGLRHAFQQDGSAAESLQLNFTRIEWRFTPRDASGSPQAPIVGGYDIATGTPR
jgi:type VI secretion system secreted protein Hcp